MLCLRVGQRGAGLSATIARSEHEISEIIDGLSEQENNEKQMRQLSVIPPMMFDAEQRRVKFINMNGLMEDPMKVYKDRQFMNVWTDHEKEIFKENTDVQQRARTDHVTAPSALSVSQRTLKTEPHQNEERFMQHPKNFALISTCLERKVSAFCMFFTLLKGICHPIFHIKAAASAIRGLSTAFCNVVDKPPMSRDRKQRRGRHRMKIGGAGPDRNAHRTGPHLDGVSVHSMPLRMRGCVALTLWLRRYALVAGGHRALCRPSVRRCAAYPLVSD
ncbi:unnamed protein product [Ranitomeya imitator]|uniref:Uncharacterized protein n=1 Tax=Ranitomeya imitator TaxID=111125 RepID=A0ABN9MFN2_9NEOB|nr:unnamed protein product [Ranitomeya imitator]